MAVKRRVEELSCGAAVSIDGETAEVRADEAVPADKTPSVEAVAGPGEPRFDWPRIFAEYGSGLYTQAELVERHGVDKGYLNRRIKLAFETAPADRPTIIARLFRLVELQVLDMHEGMREMRTENRRSGEKEVVLLGKLAANLEKLMALDGGKAVPDRKDKSRTKTIVDLRSKLIERIEHLKRQ